MSRVNNKDTVSDFEQVHVFSDFLKLSTNHRSTFKAWFDIFVYIFYWHFLFSDDNLFKRFLSYFMCQQEVIDFLNQQNAYVIVYFRFVLFFSVLDSLVLDVHIKQ